MAIKRNRESARFLRDSDVAALLGCSRCFIWKLVKREVLPEPLRLGRKWSAWRLSDIEEVINNPEKYFVKEA